MNFIIVSTERKTDLILYNNHNSKLNLQFTKAYPNIFIFIHFLNTNIKTDTYIHIN